MLSSVLWPCLACAPDDILERGQLFGAHWTAGMQRAGADTDFRAHAELTAICELSGGVPQHDGAVDAVHESFGGVCIFRHDTVSVMGAIALNMLDRSFQAIDHAHGDDGVKIFSLPVFFR